MAKLPAFVFVSWKEDGSISGSKWLSASKEAADEIEDDGPTVVGTYKLIETSELTKSVVSSKRRKRASNA